MKRFITYLKTDKDAAGIIVFCFGAALLIGLFVTMIAINWNTPMTDVTINR